MLFKQRYGYVFRNPSNTYAMHTYYTQQSACQVRNVSYSDNMNLHCYEKRQGHAHVHGKTVHIMQHVHEEIAINHRILGLM